MTQPDQAREDFEAETCRQLLKGATFERYVSGRYIDGRVHDLWRAWRAALAHERARAASAPQVPTGTTVDEAWQDLCEKDDRTSIDYPGFALIRQEELAWYMAAGPRAPVAPPAPAKVRGLGIPITDDVLGYIARYGGRCRDCADTTFGPICDGSGLPCGERRGIEHVLRALNYGLEHGYISALATPPTAPAAARSAAEAKMHAVNLEQCSIFVDSNPIKRAMTDAAAFIRAALSGEEA